MNKHDPATSHDQSIDRFIPWMFWVTVAICAGFGGWALFFRAA